MANKDNHGGAREGAGRPHKEELLELGGQTRTGIIKDIQAIADENDTTFGKELGKLIFGKRKEKRLMMQAMQLYVRDVLPKISEREVTENVVLKPEIYLPELLPDTDEAPDYKPH